MTEDETVFLGVDRGRTFLRTIIKFIAKKGEFEYVPSPATGDSAWEERSSAVIKRRQDARSPPPGSGSWFHPLR